MERALCYNVVTIFINSFFFISTYFVINTINLYTIHLLISVFISFIREITRFRCILLINNRQSIHFYTYFLLFLKIINIINLVLLISDNTQFIYTDYRFLLLYYSYDIICIFTFPKINIETNRNINLHPIRVDIHKIIIKIKLTDYNNIDECYICCDRKGDHTILDCNHNMICGICIYKLNKCPICRCNITEILELTKQ